ncbi:NADH-quinone oxidoreductase subunit J [Geothermobacter hydrogeniphilus]|uniref:NADH-quinone oxidoreductase subunit J n=1 Tax=Geothermobacter hydrogeniphilus TaxID=1969733 RepID=A0A2K2HEL7_9BACT|nr:NADH-quinone oxidoreductase subunit J [Geothermobacter hydrogeniphilus]PNU21735.1 NADH-quinone oxidoreductase subunit J [Geothermobacter hydrogeniphilus]
MTAAIFYILSAAALLATLMAITRKNPVHAVIYLVHAFFALALIFFILGAPLVAAWEVIIYAGAIMVLFLFIIMMLELTPGEAARGPGWQRWAPVILLSGSIVVCTLLLMTAEPQAGPGGPNFYASPRDFGYGLFKEYALAVEIVSFQLLFAAVGAFYVGRGERTRRRARGDER